MATKRALTAVQTSAGKGTRARPLSLSSPTSMIPKGLLRVMGLPIAEIQIEQFVGAGIKDIYVVTQYFENREYLSLRFSDGRAFGAKIKYSDPIDDKTNNGSGDAILTNLEKKRLTGDSIWLPNDNLFEFEFESVVEQHRDLGAAISIMTIQSKPLDILNTYGLLKTDAHGRTIELLEKPKDIDLLMQALNLKDERELTSARVPINTAGYILNNDVLSQVKQEDWVVEGRKSENGFDMAGDLISGLVQRGYPVHTIPIDAWGDFGSTTMFLDTFTQALGGSFPSIYTILSKRGYQHDSAKNVWIHPETLRRTDEYGSLANKMRKGQVNIGPNVFIGREAIIQNGSDIRYSDLEKNVCVGENSIVERSYLAQFCELGPHSWILDSALGPQVIVDSSKEAQTKIHGRSVFGADIKVPNGTVLHGATVYPGYTFSQEGQTHDHVQLKPTEEQVIAMAREYNQ